MRIVSVKAIAMEVGFKQQSLQTDRVASPMSRWPAFADHRASWMWPTKKAFVRIEDEAGNVGWSCTNGGEVTALIADAQLARLIVGEDTEDIPDLWDRMFFSLLPNDRSGFAMMAISAVDIALWDLLAKQKKTTLVDLLGGATSISMPAYATTTSPDLQAGKSWWGIKAAVPFGLTDGEEGLVGNIACMQTFRDAAEQGGRIMLDAFMAWDAEYTLRFAEAAGDLDIYWIEDPLPPYDLEGLRRIKQKAGSDIRLALGNFCFNRWDCKLLVDEGLVDILQPDVAWAGGITECIRIVELAHAASLPILFHNSCEQPWALALAAAKQHDPIAEYVDRGDDSPLYSLMGNRPEYQDGRIGIDLSDCGNMPPAAIVSEFMGSRP